MQRGEIVFNRHENTKDVNSHTTITIDGEHLVGRYEEYNDNDKGSCYISIILNDFEEYGRLFISYSFDHVVYINDFVCRGVIVKGKGKKLLFDVLNYIRDIKGKNTYVTLLAASKEREVNGKKMNTNDEKLMAYYRRLGFQNGELDGLMYGKIETIMLQCSPENFKSLPDLPPESRRLVATVAAGQPDLSERHQEQEPAYFSDSSVVPLGSEFDSESSDGASEGGKGKTKKNKTKKNKSKNKKSRKRWSLKYKKSINCKRPRGFSQRQYCKYGRKK